MLDAVGGSWESATGTWALPDDGWGAGLGYPGIDLDDHGREVEGFLFTSKDLSSHWEALDEFEGRGV